MGRTSYEDRRLLFVGEMCGTRFVGKEGLRSGQCVGVRQDVAGLAVVAEEDAAEAHVQEGARVSWGAGQGFGDHFLGVCERADTSQVSVRQRGLEVDAGGALPARPVVEVALGEPGDRVPVHRGGDDQVGGRPGCVEQ